MIVKETQVRPVHSVSHTCTCIDAQAALRTYKEPFLFLMEHEKVIGYIRAQDVFASRDSLPSPRPVLLTYTLDSEVSFLDLLKILGEEVILIEDHSQTLCGYLRREDILFELLRQEDHDLDLFRTILSSIPMGIFVVDKTGQIVNYNEQGLRMMRLSKETISETNAFQIFDMMCIERVLATGENILNQIHPRHELGILADYSPFVNVQGDVEGIVIVVQDLPMVEEMAMELDTVKDLNKDLRAILSAIYDEILVVNNKGELIRYSDNHMADFWETDLKELIGKNIVELEQKGLFKPSVARLVMEKKRKVSVFQETRKGKKLLVVGNPIFDEAGELDRIVIASRDITETTELKHELRQMKKISEQYKREIDSLKTRQEISKAMIYASPSMHRIMKEVEKVSRFSSTVLLLGESGVGKEVIAKAIHHVGARANQPFLKLNCAAIPEHLLESELFGYEKGAFTGADPRGKKGYFQQANTGILFLDEISELPLGLQVKLLRVLQEREIIPVGSTTTIPIDVQIIAATNKDLDAMVRSGQFREDLYYRLNVIPIEIPPLRERMEDIPLLTYHFLNRWNATHGRSVQLSPDALNLLEIYAWPGNVRELQNLIERIVVTTDDEMVESYQISQLLRWETAANKAKPIITNLMPLQEALELVEKQLIELAMERYKTTTLAAKVLGISQSSVSRKYQRLMKEHLQQERIQTL